MSVKINNIYNRFNYSACFDCKLCKSSDILTKIQELNYKFRYLIRNSLDIDRVIKPYILVDFTLNYKLVKVKGNL